MPPSARIVPAPARTTIATGPAPVETAEDAAVSTPVPTPTLYCEIWFDAWSTAKRYSPCESATTVMATGPNPAGNGEPATAVRWPSGVTQVKTLFVQAANAPMLFVPVLATKRKFPSALNATAEGAVPTL